MLPQEKEKSMIEFKTVFKKEPRKYSINGDIRRITLPKMEDVKTLDTNGYLVLIAKDNKTVIMPKYYDYLIEKTSKLLDKKGISKPQILQVH